MISDDIMLLLYIACPVIHPPFIPEIMLNGIVIQCLDIKNIISAVTVFSDRYTDYNAIINPLRVRSREWIRFPYLRLAAWLKNTI